LTLTASPDPVRPGEQLHQVVTVRNESAGPVDNVVVSVVVPSYTPFGDVGLSAGGVCPGTCEAGEVAEWSLGSLGAGETRTVQMSSRISTGAPEGALLVASASVNSVQGGALQAQQVLVDSTPLRLWMATDEGLVAPGGTLTYTLGFYNGSGGSLLNAVLRASLPAGTSFVSASGGGVLNGNAVEWSLGTVAVGARGEQQFSVVVGSGAAAEGVLVGEAVLQDGGGASSASARVATVVDADAALSLTLVATPDGVRPGERLHQVVTVRNESAGPVDNVVVSVVVPSYAVWGDTDVSAGGSCPGTTCDAGEVAEWLLGSLGAGETRTVQMSSSISTGAPEGTLLVASASVNSDSGGAIAVKAAIVDSNAAALLSGFVAHGSSGLSNVSVCATGISTYCATTNSSGLYTFYGLPVGSHVLEANRSGYSFDPASVNINVGAGSLPSQNFRACLEGEALSGVLRDATTGQGLSGVDIEVNGAVMATTDGSGNYSVPGLACGAHSVKVRLPPDSPYSSYLRTADTFNSWNQNIWLTKPSTANGLNSESAIYGDPVNTATGNYAYQRNDLVLPGKGLPFAFERSYNSQAASAPAAVGGRLGYGWTHNYNTSAEVDESGIASVPGVNK